MPDPKEYENESDWMAACVPVRIEEGDEQDQAVAVCMSMWKEKKNVEPSETLVWFGQEVKALDDAGRIGGYLVRFSTSEDPDISPQRDFFTKETDFMVMFPANSPAWFNHAMDAKKKRLSHDASLTEDDFGVWAETILDERDQYEKFLLELAKSGKLGWSSGTASHLVERAPVGSAQHVKRWPLGLDASLTHIPAEPRNSVIPLKSLSELTQLPDDLETSAETVRDTVQGDGTEAEAKTTTLEAEQSASEENIMEITEEKLSELMQGAAEAALKSLPAVQPAANITVIKDEADQEFASPGEFFKAVKMAALYPGQEDARLKPLKATGLSEGVPADGGYLLQPQVSGGIIEKMLDTGKILGRVAMDSVGGNSMVYNGFDESTHVGSVFGGVIGYWLNEGGTKTASAPKFYQVSLKLKKIAALCYATDELLEDVTALQGWLTRTVPEVLRWYVESAIISGNGTGRPLGITQSPCLVSQVREDANEINPSDFAAMWSRRYQGANDYVWIVNPTVMAWMNMFSVGNWPVFMPQGSMVGKPYATVYGAPVIESEHVAAAKSAGDVLLASLSNYQTIQKGGVQSASSIHVAFTTDETAFRFVYRIDGSPLWNSALTPENGSTVSPFVSLAAASS